METQQFFDAIRDLFGGRLNAAQVQGMEALLRAAIAEGVTDPHHVADILAQVKHETGGYMLPIKETVMPSHKDKNPSDATVIARLNKAYASGRMPWVNVSYWRDGGFGRGPIQLTHWENYEKMGRRLGVDLRGNPDLALDPDIGARIAVVGMKEGLFTGRKLADYRFPDALDADPGQHPRRIVNGRDGTDDEIARNHRAFYAALMQAGWSDARLRPAPPDGLPQAAYSGAFSSQLERVQRQLAELGYHEVGTVDGRWGSRTRGAILAFRADKGLAPVPVADGAFLIALASSGPRTVAPARAEMTVDKLRAEGAEEVRRADVTQTAGGVVAGFGVLVGVEQALRQVEDYSALAKRAAELAGPVSSFIAANGWLAAALIGGVIVWQAVQLKRLRVVKHQQGLDLSK